MAYGTYREDGDGKTQQCRCPDCLLPPDGPSPGALSKGRSRLARHVYGRPGR